MNEELIEATVTPITCYRCDRCQSIYPFLEVAKSCCEQRICSSPNCHAVIPRNSVYAKCLKCRECGKQEKWRSLERRALKPSDKLLYSDVTNKYYPADLEALIDDAIEQDDKINTEDFQNIADFYRIYHCEEEKPHHINLAEEYDEFIPEDFDPPDGWKELELAINQWIDRSEWGYCPTNIAWSGEIEN
jgi:hypothetical protein